MEKDLKWIKKHYGEEMMHLCREFFPRILEDVGTLPKLLQEHFPSNRFLAKDIKEQSKEDSFKNYIYSLFDSKEEKKFESTESAVDLMRKAGYVLYPECKTENDVQSFKKWWKKGEELCTFNGGRLDSCRVWFAVKEDASEIKRDDFLNPQRQDDYGTSVISIQFTKGETQYLSIKNRYNHTVGNPDNTFNSNLDNIIEGLTDAFEKDYGVRDFTTRAKDILELKNYVRVDGKYYHYNYEINNKYYCDNNIIIDNFEVKQLPTHQMLIDYFIFDFKEKDITKYDIYFVDDFTDSFYLNVKNITKKENVIIVEREDDTIAEIEIDNRNNIVSYKDENLIECTYDWLSHNKKLKNLYLPNLRFCGCEFLKQNKELKKLSLPSLEECDYEFLRYNSELEEVYLPKLKQCGNGFLGANEKLKTISLPSLQKCADDFISSNHCLKSINLPSLQKCGSYFLFFNDELTSLKLPEIVQCGNFFLNNNKNINQISMPNIEKVGDYCFVHNKKLEELNLPSLNQCGNNFMFYNENLKSLKMPNLKSCGNYFLFINLKLKTLNLPNLKSCLNSFLESNTELTKIVVPEELAKTKLSKLVKIVNKNNEMKEYL